MHQNENINCGIRAIERWTFFWNWHWLAKDKGIGKYHGIRSFAHNVPVTIIASFVALNLHSLLYISTLTVDYN